MFRRCIIWGGCFFITDSNFVLRLLLLFFFFTPTFGRGISKIIGGVIALVDKKFFLDIKESR